jgi:hypothetical protein
VSFHRSGGSHWSINVKVDLCVSRLLVGPIPYVSRDYTSIAQLVALTPHFCYQIYFAKLTPSLPCNVYSIVTCVEGFLWRLFHCWGVPHHFWWFFLSFGTISCHPTYRCPFVSYVAHLIENPAKDWLFDDYMWPFDHPTPFLVRIGVLSSLVTPAVFIALLLIGLQLTRASHFPFQSSVPRIFV